MWDAREIQTARPPHIFRNVQVQVSALRDVDELHAHADAEHRQAAFGDLVHQHAVERFAAIVHQPAAWVAHPAVTCWVEIRPADKHEAVELFEQRFNIGFFGLRKYCDCHSTGMDTAL